MNFYTQLKNPESRLLSRRPAKTAVWPALAGELVLHGPPFQSGLTRRDLNCHSGQLCWPNLEQMEANLKQGGGTESYYVILPLIRAFFALSFDIK